jgi:hypothetical protein
MPDIIATLNTDNSYLIENKASPTINRNPRFRNVRVIHGGDHYLKDLEESRQLNPDLYAKLKEMDETELKVIV